jgi:hypothetical protein
VSILASDNRARAASSFFCFVERDLETVFFTLIPYSAPRQNSAYQGRTWTAAHQFVAL